MQRTHFLFGAIIDQSTHSFTFNNDGICVWTDTAGIKGRSCTDILNLEGESTY